MIFTGYGIVWNPRKNKILCDFQTGTYETHNLDEIEILKACPQADYVSGEVGSAEKKTRKQLILEAKDKGIKGADRMKTDDLIDALGTK